MTTDIPAPSPAPQLRVPGLCMPAYRYIPGKHPHPTKHPQGHNNALCDPPLPKDWASTPNHKSWLRGLDLFDHRYYWECHEQLEEVWKIQPHESPSKALVQGIILAAAFLLKHHMGHYPAVTTLQAHALTRLTHSKRLMGDSVWGIHLPSLMEVLKRSPNEVHWPMITGPAGS